MSAYKVLFVCMGNICRSPSAEGVFRQLLEKHNLLDRIDVDSAGTEGWHTGSPPDLRATKAASLRGIDLSPLRARQVEHRDLHDFDLIIAMDRHNHTQLQSLAGANQYHHKIRLLLDYSERYDFDEVPDPYYGGDHGFDQVLDMIEDSCEQLLQSLMPGR